MSNDSIKEACPCCGQLTAYWALPERIQALAAQQPQPDGATLADLAAECKLITAAWHPQGTVQDHYDALKRFAQAITKAAQPQQGYVLVPREPTPQMIRAYQSVAKDGPCHCSECRYKAMLAASPGAPAQATAQDQKR